MAATDATGATDAHAAIRRARRLRALHEAALTIAAPVPAAPAAVAVLLAAIVESAVRAMAARDGRLVLSEDPAWADLVPGDAETAGAIVLDHTGRLSRVRQRPNGATAYALRHGEFVCIPDVRTDTRFGPYPQLIQPGIGSLALVPLHASGHVLGVLGVSFNAPGELEVEDREALELFAAHAAASLERVRHGAITRQARLEGALLVTRTVAHELNNALGVIVGYADLLAQRPAVSLDPAVAAEVQHVVRAAGEASALVQRLQQIIRLEEAPSPLGPSHPILDLERSTTP